MIEAAIITWEGCHAPEFVATLHVNFTGKR
jgi:hypothetical protein